MKNNTALSSRLIVMIFFLSFLFLGLFIFPHYGISWDEFIQRISGYISYKYITGEKDILLRFEMTKYYGPAFELVLIGIEQILNIEQNLRATFLMRHLVTFLLFFISTVCFYRLCRRIFSSWKVGLLGAALLILSPRIFAHAFYNSKDIPFMSVFIISIYTLVCFLDKKSFGWAVIHAVICAFLTDIRIMGILVPVLTGLVFFIDIILNKVRDKELLQKGVVFLIYVTLTCIFVVLFWPILWTNPVGHLILAFKEMSQYPSYGHVLYFGNFVSSQNLPWHYVFGWIGVTTPLFYVVMFLMGLGTVLFNFIRKPKDYYLYYKGQLIAMVWFFVPIMAVIVLQSVLYDAWRQIFFVYPGFVLISLTGIVTIYEFCRQRRRLFLRNIWIVVVCLAMGFIAFRMIKMHPYQNVYFNVLAGRDIEKNFERDYWGLSYRQGLEYILSHDSEEEIPVYVQNPPGEKNAYLLRPEERKRLVYVKDPMKAKYFLTNFKGRQDEFAGDAEEFYTVTVDGFKILGVYRFGG
ncbi:MAG: glycosyltransferase family 39 protein [Candidatus Omnitrophica bacterium]|nr:glycosyltransferase family 39 protein [Candidatus Omnitrophota bacterium]